MGERIMLIGEDLKFCKKLKYELQDDRLQCYYALGFTDGLRHLLRYPYRLVLYEISAINTTALHQMEQIRAVRPEVLLLVICFNMVPQDYAVVLTTADNIIPHPCDGQTYKDILEAVLRRSARSEPIEKHFLISKDGNVLIDPTRRTVTLSDTKITLQRRQFDLLYFLMAHEGRVFGSNQIFQRVWNDDFDGDEHALRNQISKLRKTLKISPSTREYIQTVYGVGYCFNSD